LHTPGFGVHKKFLQNLSFVGSCCTCYCYALPEWFFN
jgi:hypothetical protein